MSNATSIRPATEADLPEIVRITNRAYIVEEFCIQGDRTHAADITLKMSQGAFLVLDAEAQPGKLIGSVYALVDKGRGYLGLLAVDPDAQGAGISRRLVDAVEAHCRERQCRFLDLTVLSVRKELFPFYRKLGFHPADVVAFPRPDLQKLPLHLVKMTKALVPVEQL